MSVYTALVTGANSGLGYSTCCRLIDEFLSTRPASQSLHLIFTTRDAPKSTATLRRLQSHLSRTIRSVYGSAASTQPIRTLHEARITLEGETLDLCKLATVKACARRLVERGLKIDVVVLNAGIGGWTGMDWPLAIWSVLSHPLEGTTFPCFKLGDRGKLCKPQRGPGEPALGEVFAANVFGHYLLCHWLGDVLRGGRVVWTSSVEVFTHSFEVGDVQGLGTDAAYDSSKRLTEILALTSGEEECKRWVERWFPGEHRPEQYLAHPGVCLTPISGIPLVMTWLQLIAFYIVRWIGSPWHPIEPYKGAVSAVWLALASKETLEKLEGAEGKAKWGAATDRFGGERVVRTEVDGWGWGGKKGDASDKTWRLKQRWWRPEVVRKEDSADEFRRLGAEAWKEMEELRVTWEEILKDV
ncbi:hypothetical protein K461DRAFT_292637 [Myriangium duriaei CBS 260.36]|uniref:3-keto-steroid reductase n=1 Tax=Myriangium duriaei CBS 260.36 TaxID=1168546 RepID=A0A9P4ML86_9PEZI|nr:hypothetical protein K461DRAFT_292637 [Myriangium duriaei CBS 260.36]